MTNIFCPNSGNILINILTLSQSIKSKANLKPKDARFKVPTSATGEKRKQSEFLDPEEKRPKFIIIGSTKCSTSALLRNTSELDL